MKEDIASEGVEDETLHQLAIGCLLYLATRTRSDLAYAVSNIAWFCSKLMKPHWTAANQS